VIFVLLLLRFARKLGEVGKQKYLLIAYFPISNSAENYQNRITNVKVIARQRSDIFF